MPTETDDVWVIWSFEHDAWWAPNRMGYTTALAGAGRYTEAEASAIVKAANITGVAHERALTLAEAEAHGAPPE